jgi:hypothetical protein
MTDLLGSDDHVVALVRESAHRGEHRLEPTPRTSGRSATARSVNFAAQTSDQYADDEFYG